jgi:hypothetical protein
MSFPDIPNDERNSFIQKFDSWSTSEEVMEGIDLNGKVYLVTGATTGLGFYSRLVKYFMIKFHLFNGVVN